MIIIVLLERVLKNNSELIGNIIPFDLNKEKIFIFDFTKDNKDLQKFNIASAEAFDNYIKETMKSNGATAGIGKYNEDRTIYRHSALYGTNESQLRTVHLAIDVFLPEGTEIFSPLDARVHSFQNNKGTGDYGPTIILEHELDDVTFYTLYGHLSEDSPAGKYEGQVIKKGEVIGRIGNIYVNGNWPEHVHFQIISDMMGKKGDFPGVSNILEREKYLEICPDPNLILKINRLL